MKLRELIKDELNKGITQRELAKRIGFSHGTIQKILFTDTKFTYETRKKVADYFRIPVSQFYDAIAIPDTAAGKVSIPAPDERLAEMQRSITKLYESIIKLHEIADAQADEIGRIKDRLLDASSSGDIKRLDFMAVKGPSRVN